MSRLMKYVKLKRKLTYTDEDGYEWVRHNIHIGKKETKQLKNIGWSVAVIND